MAQVVLGEEDKMALIEGYKIRSPLQDVAGWSYHVSLRYGTLAYNGCLTL
jgi:hypothetical protein